MRISDWSSDVCSSDLFEQGLVDGLRVGHDQQGVAVGLGARHRGRADDRAGSRLVLDHDRLAELLLQLLAQIAGIDIRGTTGTNWSNSGYEIGRAYGRSRACESG